jgi:hypothetical protein
MLDFVSPQGREELVGLRLGLVPDVTGGSPPVELLACVPSEECGCPEEIWLVNGLTILIHMEAEDGTGEAFIFAGDWEAERSFQCANINGLRSAMFGWLAEMPANDKEPSE